jgi:hypothetical protein
MKRLIRFVVSSLGVVAVALFLAAAPASATLVVLSEWNNAAIDASTAQVTVNSTEGGGNTTLVVTYQPGDFPNTLLGIDQFGYQSATDCCLAGSTAGWSFTGDGNMDGFGKFLRQSAVGGGTDLTLTFIIAGTGLGLDSLTDFAAHVRFAGLSGSCSGYVGGTNIATGDTGAGCGASVAEPSILALVGLGFVGLGLVSRRWRKQQVA